MGARSVVVSAAVASAVLIFVVFIGVFLVRREIPVHFRVARESLLFGLLSEVVSDELAVGMGAVSIEVERKIAWCWWHNVDEVYPPAVWGTGIVSFGHWPCVEEGGVVLLCYFAEGVL